MVARKRGIDPDEILMNAGNLSQMNQQQFEGVIERPISARMFSIAAIAITLIAVLFVARLTKIQIADRQQYQRIADENRVHRIPIFSARGVITDRYGMQLAWNTNDPTVEYLRRSYQNVPGLSHLLGFVRYPKADAKGVYWREYSEGVGGLEQLLDAQLRGKTGYQLVEERGDKKEDINTIARPVAGQNIALTIDGHMQMSLGRQLQTFMDQYGYEAAGGVIMDVHTGDVLALVSLPDYDANRITAGDSEYLKSLLTNPRNPFLNRITHGLFTPGSIVKPFVALEALEEGVIDQNTTVLSTGYIEVPNKYDPDNPSRFHDWKPGGHGVTDVEHAIANSVNTFFYAIGGGYRGQKGIGITGVEKSVQRFGIGEPVDFVLSAPVSGTVPTPAWKQKNMGESWRLGDTYISAIGQFGFQVSPLQMVRAISGIANGNALVEPRLMPTEEIKSTPLTIDQSALKIVQDGMRLTVTEGTAQMLNIGTLEAAAKTGSAQVGVKKDKVNSWVVGYYPASDPQYAFVMIAERGPKQGAPNVGWAMRGMLQELSAPAQTE